MQRRTRPSEGLSQRWQSRPRRIAYSFQPVWLCERDDPERTLRGAINEPQAWPGRTLLLPLILNRSHSHPHPALDSQLLVSWAR